MKVKVPVRVVIESLNKRLEESKANAEKNNEAEKQFHLANRKWAEDFVIQFRDVLEVTQVRARSYSKDVEVSYTLPEGAVIPEQPTRKFEKVLAGWEVEEIENAIRILNITEDEYVSASTMKQIGRFI